MNKENVKEFLVAMDSDWRTRYSYITKDKVVEMDILDNSKVKSKIISIAHFDPCNIVRSEAVKTCNLLNILYKGQKVTLRKMRTLNNTLIAEKINMTDIVLDVFLKAEIPFFPRNRKISGKEWDRVYEQFKLNYPKVYDLLDGHFTVSDTYKNRKQKNKVQIAIKSSDRKKINNYVKGVIDYIPRKQLISFCKKHDIEIEVKGEEKI